MIFGFRLALNFALAEPGSHQLRIWKDLGPIDAVCCEGNRFPIALFSKFRQILIGSATSKGSFQDWRLVRTKIYRIYSVGGFLVYFGLN